MAEHYSMHELLVKLSPYYFRIHIASPNHVIHTGVDSHMHSTRIETYK
jgi:hypothetical protein